ncbi:long-chain-fatty-acid--CoA ligase ACSBG2 isoform X2 [Bacillus rossius redtenbacheri]|uniref:long-chain-fatty-acid--CoA ligase ACSBG2 isoform X2 n=1 Tax=Bacillus rossius redtenbacheri TaxID=93214 RepID=UPI002FDEB5AA
MYEGNVLGPDQVVPADGAGTSSPAGRVRLRLGESGEASLTPVSVPGLLDRAATSQPATPALAWAERDDWALLTFSEYREAVRTCAKAFLSLGLKRWHGVCILGFNSPEWFISDLAAIHAGGVACGIYATNSPEACYHCLSDSRANIAVAGDHEQLEKILAVKDRLPELATVIQYSGAPRVPGVLSWEDVMRIGREQSDEQLESTLKTLAINECCTLVYTSGTVGAPKGAMLSHDNLTWTAQRVAQTHGFVPGEPRRAVSFLPLSHVAAQVIDIYVPIEAAITIYFADKDALKGTLFQTVQKVRPTSFFGVPRVWEKLRDAIDHSTNQNSNLKNSFVSWARRQSLQHNIAKMNGIEGISVGYRLAKHLVFDRVKTALGFDCCTVLSSGAAPLSDDTKEFFMSYDMIILEGYGMSEIPVHTTSLHTAFRVGSIGRNLPGTETKIQVPTQGVGELLFRGRNVFMGYLNDEASTRASVDGEGWLHSGDIGRQDDCGFIYVLGRLKEIIITSGGENVPPMQIENEVKKELPIVSHAFLVGDKRKFLSVLLTFKTEQDPDSGLPLDRLSSDSRRWLEKLSCDASTVAQLLQSGNEKVMAAIQDGIDQVNSRATSNAQKIQKFSILPQDFSVKTGELGPTLKLKRKVIETQYRSTIEQLYSNV